MSVEVNTKGYTDYGGVYMASRLDLHELLCSVLELVMYIFNPRVDQDAVSCIVYKRSSINTRFADDELTCVRKGIPSRNR